jgi:hypothetical protein
MHEHPLYRYKARIFCCNAPQLQRCYVQHKILAAPASVTCSISRLVARSGRSTSILLGSRRSTASSRSKGRFVLAITTTLYD